MFWKRKSKNEIAEQKLDMMNDLLKKSFANVKKDTGQIFQWLNHFYRKSLEQEQLIKQFKNELQYVPKTREEIRKIVDDYYSFDSITSRIKDLNEKVDHLSRKMDNHNAAQQHQAIEQRQTHHFVQQDKAYDGNIESIRDRLQRLEQKKHSMKEKIVKKIARNSKDYVKSVVMSYIRKYERVSALQLKEIVVDEQSFCSKSSFYRLLEEIEQNPDIGVIKEGKEKHYLSKARKLSE